MALQHLRSSTANKRANPASMADGQLALNTNNGSPGLFFKDSNGNLVKVGPVHVGTTAPNVTPASGGTAGNSIGEQWLDTSSSKYVFKIWDGTAWRSEVGEFVDAAGDVMTGALGIIAGTASAPGLYISGDTNTGLYAPAADQLALSTGGTGRLFIDDGGRIMAGVSTALTNAYAIGTALTPVLQIQGNTANGAALSITRNTSAAANLLLQRGVTGTPVADTEALGQISFNGFDGANYFNAALIRAVVDGTPGTGAMPGRLSFQTTPTGSTTPIERLRIGPAGQIMAAALGTAAAPIWSFTGDPDTGLYSPSADQLSISTGGTQRLNVSTTAVSSTLPIDHPLGTASAPGITFTGDLNTGIYSPGADQVAVATNGTGRIIVGSTGTVDIVGAGTAGTTQAVSINGSAPVNSFVVDSSGRCLVGTSTARANLFNGTVTSVHQVEVTASSTAEYLGVRNQNNTTGADFVLAKSRGTTAGSNTIVQNGDILGTVAFMGSDGTEFVLGGRILCEVDGTPGANDMPGRIVFSTTADGASSPTEAMRITSAQDVLVGATSTNLNNTGIGLHADGFAYITRANTPLSINRKTTDGSLIDLRQDNTIEGSISVSGTTVTYGGGHLARWSQLLNSEDPSNILKGTVMSNLDEMCEWGEEDNEQLNKTKISDVEGDKNVAGVFVSTSFSDDGPLDFFVAMTGDMVIRIAEGVTVERGDLLMSAGDGTAKPQDDDIIRSKTIAKVTSTTVSCTYEDGSYCVPCVLMAC